MLTLKIGSALIDGERAGVRRRGEGACFVGEVLRGREKQVHPYNPEEANGVEAARKRGLS